MSYTLETFFFKAASRFIGDFVDNVQRRRKAGHDWVSRTAGGDQARPLLDLS